MNNFAISPALLLLNSPIVSIQCPIPNSQCPMPNAQCPIPNSYTFKALIPVFSTVARPELAEYYTVLV
ncbi:MAG: hypothetical protein F6J93_05365 [Oscillatoria sp. SIO1A7]|nr:hypothetical protein [Oscillatoria sp. SIO1A7]